MIIDVMELTEEEMSALNLQQILILRNAQIHNVERKKTLESDKNSSYRIKSKAPAYTNAGSNPSNMIHQRFLNIYFKVFTMYFIRFIILQVPPKVKSF